MGSTRMTARATTTHDLRLHRVRDVLLGQLDDAIGRLKKNGKSDTAVHDVRRELKRARATLRLLRKSMGGPAYRRDNWAIRDVARLLTPLRDAKVLVRTLGRLRRVGDDNDLGVAGSLLTRQFQQGRQAIARRLLPKHLMAAADVLRTVKERVCEIPRPRLDECSISEGLGRVYKAGRRAFRRVKDQGTDGRLHEWRKQVKYLLNQLDVARQLGGAKLKKRRKYSQRLADILGDDHDLAVLNAKIKASADPEVSRRFAGRIEKRRAVLQREARRVGRLLYGGKASPEIRARRASDTVSFRSLRRA
jgi:CHAD domain-containing protein